MTLLVIASKAKQSISRKSLITMPEKFKITKFQILSDYKLKLFFGDGVSGVVDLSHLKGEGVFKIWDDYEEFKKVSIDPITHTVCWRSGVDLDPRNLRRKIIT